MLHLIYILAFTIIAFFAISNLIKSLITISIDSQKGRWSADPKPSNRLSNTSRKVTHPELLDNQGKIINEPLLVMRSFPSEDIREKLDSIYDSSPSQTQQKEEES